MKKITALLLFWGITLSVFAQRGAPAWYLQKDLEYPDGEYLSAIGNGPSETAAKERALAEISLFFKAGVNFSNETVSNYNRTVAEGRTAVSGGTSMRERIVISSREDFLGVRYAASWYDAGARTWYACCYINKGEAQGIYKNRIRTNRTIFDSLSAAGNGEGELLYKYGYYKKAADLGRVIEADINSLPVVGADTGEFAPVLQEIKKQQSDYDGLRSGISFSIRIRGDRQGRIERTLSAQLAGMGRPVRSGAAYLLEGTVSLEEMSTPSIPYNLICTIQLELRSAAGKTVFTYNRDLGRVSHRVSWEGAYNAAILEIEKDIEENFMNEFNSSLDG
jgi:hypothetical protein